jgi:hypothetical protein
MPSHKKPTPGREGIQQLAGSLNIGGYARVLDDDAVRKLLRAAIEREGNQLAFSQHSGINRTVVNQVLSGHRPITKSVLKALLLRRVYIVDEKQ